ncbi:MAG: Crp/Fnr family transcriptional regulator [Eubacteriales bacterium]|nr:Crp/Fnr family transcriptional regulator [Eubacteriales bacterium]
MDQFLTLLEKLNLFSGIAREEIAPLYRRFGCYTTQYEKGAILWNRGDQVKAAGIVLSGCVQAEQNTADGVQRIVARHSAGSLFGDVLMSSQMQKSPVDIVACENTQVLFLPLVNIMGDSCGATEAQVRFRLNLLSEISDKYWALYRRISCLMAPSVRGRVARYLLHEREEQGSDSLQLSCTRENMAAQLCVNRSAMCRELGRMQREGLLILHRRTCTLCNISHLEAIAER